MVINTLNMMHGDIIKMNRPTDPEIRNFLHELAKKFAKECDPKDTDSLSAGYLYVLVLSYFIQLVQFMLLDPKWSYQVRDENKN